jgi:ring-1,2-phenylacetyl-CoA epoxidase subunit PaaE
MWDVFHSVYSQASGRALLVVSKSNVNFVLNNKHKELDLISFTFATRMINTVSAVLKEKNVKESAIKFELF